MNASSILYTIHNEAQAQLSSRIRRVLLLFIVLLALSGITAFPVQTEMHLLVRFSDMFPPFVHAWIMQVSGAIDDVTLRYPYLFYGYDWLGFAHLVIAMFFIGAWKNPVANRWVIRTGMVACAGVFLLAFVSGPLRGIPVVWTLVDCSFGFFGLIPLLLIDRWTGRLIALQND